MIPQPPETEVVTAKRVCCDGGEGALGHPRVWLSLGEDGEVECPYCDKKFVLEGKSKT
ncbi:zinc-finger domain-containing protein [Aliiruegeria lutimaris]|uniref:zinc-finger domain-containing protein n=1 Tax=Aliiruegeria lutimaris TaxID=571298 RepID=UPI000B830718|nr:zinc-finger domain-containing protein [Aliiruegeria lutimaris]